MHQSRKLTALLLSDGRPGHYHLAEGVIAAVERRRPVTTVRLDVRRRKLAPARLLADMLARGVSPALVLRLGYGMDVGTLPKAALVVSAGGDTTAANVACARALGAENIYCGTLKRFPAEALSLVVSSYAAHEGLPRHVVTLKPNGTDPDTLAQDLLTRPLGPASPPRQAGLLVGGNSGLFSYQAGEWKALLAFLRASHAAHGTRWIVSTSRRTDDSVADHLLSMAAEADGPITDLLDFRTAGPGTLPGLFARAEAILCTEDSSTMISEAVCARRPVVGVSPRSHDFKSDEREYRTYMRANNWCRFMPLTALTPATFLAALGEITPLTDNHLERLAARLEERLPRLFRD